MTRLRDIVDEVDAAVQPFIDPRPFIDPGIQEVERLRAALADLRAALRNPLGLVTLD